MRVCRYRPENEICSIRKWKEGYKRQMEIYQWLLRGMGFDVEETGYFVYVNVLKTPERFDGRLTFDIQLLDYKGDDDWVGPAILKAHACLAHDTFPEADPEYEYCRYRESVKKVEN
ncbi:MAG: hypothetical protein HYU99_00985 [Deltaproteobacteria bacterium]|nr:hypothetical protein [Deltaproteobacteria bacterium]